MADIQQRRVYYHPRLASGYQSIMKVMQYVMGRISLLMMPIFWAKLEVEGLENLNEVTGPLLILANHKSYYDPLVVNNALFPAKHLFPIRYFSKDQLYYNPVGSWFYALAGAFPAFYKQGLDKSLHIPRAILQAGGVVMMFPEGACIRTDYLGEGKVGAAALASQIPDLWVLPMAIHRSYQIAWRVKKGLPEVRVQLGKPYKFDKNQHGADLGATTREFMSQIQTLFDRVKEEGAVREGNTFPSPIT
jgi:1-acyl-sn-glycerol-3-phosphate acyltransferase